MLSGRSVSPEELVGAEVLQVLRVGRDALAAELDDPQSDLSLAEHGERMYTTAMADEMRRRCRELESLIAAAAELVGPPQLDPG